MDMGRALLGKRYERSEALIFCLISFLGGEAPIFLSLK
jgi:hypothetical protein